MSGYVHVYTGDGKGKTTAALGLALRAAGAGMNVFIAQFAKARTCSEHKALERFSDLVTIRRYGSGRFIGDRPTESDKAATRQGIEEARSALLSGAYQMVILDEANVATKLGLLPVEALVALIAERPADVELVITGRGADASVIEAADLVTEMRAVKHYHERGVQARPGIEL